MDTKGAVVHIHQCTRICLLARDVMHAFRVSTMLCTVKCLYEAYSTALTHHGQDLTTGM